MSLPPRFKEEQVLVICPGSETTMARLGITDLPTPELRIRTRMFWHEDLPGGGWCPYRTYKRKKAPAVPTAGALVGDNIPAADADEYEWVEDKDSDEGAIYPMMAGQIIHMECFLAFIEHVHSLLATTYHNTPIVLMTSPQWQKHTIESIVTYIFERAKTPALMLLHSALASQFGLKWTQQTIIDIGYEKVDVTCVFDGVIDNQSSLGVKQGRGKKGFKLAGGDMFTYNLMQLLKPKGWTYDMCEQLKKSSICEVLPYEPDLPKKMNLPKEDAPGTAETAPMASAPKIVEPQQAPIAVADANDIVDVDDKAVDNDGVLDVASIVTSGQTKEFLAKKEKEKFEKTKGKKGKDSEAAAAAKVSRLPNSKRVRNTFHYEDLVEVEEEAANGNGTNGDANGGTAAAKPKTRLKKVRRDIEVGLERFTFAQREQIDRIAEKIYLTIQGIPDPGHRQPCWDNLNFVGGGSRLKGLKENVLQTLIARYLISPSSATMFTSELPSNIATPSGTGAQTPTGSFTGVPHQLPTNAGSSGVNPLLQAATTAASLGIPGGGAGGQGGSAAGSAVGGDGGGGSSSHRHYQQTPTSIKLAPPITYLAEWSKHGFEDAMFLGCMIAARLAFTQSTGDALTIETVRTMSLYRTDYNNEGPGAIHTHSYIK